MVRTLQNDCTHYCQVSSRCAVVPREKHANIPRFSEKYPETRFYKLDIDEVPDIAQELGIRAMPTFVFFKNGEKVGEVVGANPKAIEAGIQEHASA
jgi:thiol-disulfide isomerase/thioredoxin